LDLSTQCVSWQSVAHALPSQPPHHPHLCSAPAAHSGLRALQGRAALRQLLSFVKAARDNLDWGPGGAPPLLVKVAPDLGEGDKADIAAVVLDTGVDGLVVSNTTITRPGAGVECQLSVLAEGAHKR
jgi:dihydroorotate dehydrogenase